MNYPEGVEQYPTIHAIPRPINVGAEPGGCTVRPIPQPRYPVYTTSVRAVIPAGQTTAALTFEAERDTLFTTLTVGAAGDPDVFVFFSAEYCNTKIVQNAAGEQFRACCPRKPVFLISVRENKRLNFVATLAAPVASDVTVTFTLGGYQGNGCCPAEGRR